MKPLRYLTVAVIVALSGFSSAQSAEQNDPDPGSAKEPLVGSWRLAWMEEQGADGKVTRTTDRKGMLIFTRDGHMSVQVMYPASEAASSHNPVQYAQGGYEASFGTYEVNEQAQTLTEHLEGSLVRALVGRDLPRVYRFSGGRLTIRSSQPDEHWSVTWKHD